MARWSALMVVLTFACSQQGLQARSTPSDAPSVEASASAPAPSTPTPTGPALACRIPVMVPAPAGVPPGGWITFPGRVFERDPSSAIKRAGDEGLTFDRAVNRWISAFWQDVSPDGRRYVWFGVDSAGRDGGHIVDLVTGADRTVVMPRVNGAWTIVDFTAKGVYLTLLGGLGPAEPGLWLLDPDSLQVKKLDGTQYWTHVDGQAAWGVKLGAQGMELRRLDLRSSTLSTQFSVPFHTPLQTRDRAISLVGLDVQGRPVVMVNDWQSPFPWSMATLVGQGRLQPIPLPDEWAANWHRADNGDPMQRWREVKGYSLTQGMWMIGPDFGLALYAQGRITQLTAAPEVFAIAGGCR